MLYDLGWELNSGLVAVGSKLRQSQSEGTKCSIIWCQNMDLFP